MKCPFCESKSVRVTDVRSKDSKLYRRRECLQCSGRFTTYEVDTAMLMEIFEDRFPFEITLSIAEILEKEFPARSYK